jgi:tRNA(adenine34) deaminase
MLPDKTGIDACKSALCCIYNENLNAIRLKEELFSDAYFMRLALAEASHAFEKDEVPVGAVVVVNKTIIARAHNLTETLLDVTAHAEMQAITAAANSIGSKYLDECTMFVTLEPCLMCAGALYWAQLGRLVYGASDPKKGYTLNTKPVLHPKTEVISGILAKESEDLLKAFFQKKR